MAKVAKLKHAFLSLDLGHDLGDVFGNVMTEPHGGEVDEPDRPGLKE